jgi:hypothetical protein
MVDTENLLFYAGLVSNMLKDRGKEEALDGAMHLLAKASKADILAASNVLADSKRDMLEVRGIFMDVAKRKQSV